MYHVSKNCFKLEIWLNHNFLCNNLPLVFVFQKLTRHDKPFFFVFTICKRKSNALKFKNCSILSGNQHYQCGICAWSHGITLAGLLVHIRQNHPDSTPVFYLCLKCDKMFFAGFKLRIHLRRHFTNGKLTESLLKWIDM